MRKVVCPHFADEEAEAQEAEVACPKSTGFGTLQVEACGFLIFPGFLGNSTAQGFQLNAADMDTWAELRL